MGRLCAHLGDVPALDRGEAVCARDGVHGSVAEDLDAVCGVQLPRVQSAKAKVTESLVHDEPDVLRCQTYTQNRVFVNTSTTQV